MFSTHTKLNCFKRLSILCLIDFLMWLTLENWPGSIFVASSVEIFLLLVHNSYRLIDLLNDLFIDLFIDWLIGWLIGWFFSTILVFVFNEVFNRVTVGNWPGSIYEESSVEMRLHQCGLDCLQYNDAWLMDYARGTSLEMYARRLSDAFAGMTFTQACEFCYLRLKIVLVAVKTDAGNLATMVRPLFFFQNTWLNFNRRPTKNCQCEHWLVQNKEKNEK